MPQGSFSGFRTGKAKHRTPSRPLAFSVALFTIL
jgi:hypothetical protein